jgi:hypothetical protein
VTWNFLITDIGAPYQGDLGLSRSFPQGVRPQLRQPLGHLGRQAIKPDSPRGRHDSGGGAQPLEAVSRGKFRELLVAGSGRRPWPGLGSASRCGPRTGS